MPRCKRPSRPAAERIRIRQEPADGATVVSFEPQIGPDCRVLVLGTAPSRRSLAMQQSYAHPHNLFWPFMGVLFGVGPELEYAQRVARLHALGIGIWDVLAQCDRPGSLDSSIRTASEVPNDIAGLLERNPTINAVALNGAKAHQVWRRRIVPSIAPGIADRLTVLALPSTSPANASIPRATKLQRWRALLRHLRTGEYHAIRVPPHSAR